MVKIIEKENGQIDVSFVITSPMRVYEQFKDTADKEYGGCYWLYIKDLMEKGKMITYVDNIIQETDRRLSEIEDKIEKKEDTEELTLGGLRG
jgi:hypothetical protein